MCITEVLNYTLYDPRSNLKVLHRDSLRTNLNIVPLINPYHVLILRQTTPINVTTESSSISDTNVFAFRVAYFYRKIVSPLWIEQRVQRLLSRWRDSLVPNCPASESRRIAFREKYASSP